MDRFRFQFLDGNVLKIIALITMTADHIGMILFPQQLFWRYIGRLAFPIFAFMIAEGCYYTKNRKKHIGMVFAVGILCQIVMYLTEHSLYMCIMITFTFSILIIYALQKAIPDRNRGKQEKQNISGLWCFITLLLICAAAFICLILPKILVNTDFQLDYGFFGVMLPAVIYLPNLFLKNKNAWCRLLQILIMAVWIIPVWLTTNRWEWMAVFSAVFLVFYNGQKGRHNIKYLFYFYYPAHLGILYLIQMMTN